MQSTGGRSSEEDIPMKCMLLADAWLRFCTGSVRLSDIRTLTRGGRCIEEWLMDIASRRWVLPMAVEG